jgi:hypothetical protein
MENTKEETNWGGADEKLMLEWTLKQYNLDCIHVGTSVNRAINLRFT